MIAMVEGAKRQKTPNEIALDILLAGADDRLPARDRDAAAVLAVRRPRRGAGRARSPVTLTVLVALLVCLIPTTIGGLLSAIGIAAWTA
jgi:K+-transporting ATPase ATPase B chain